MVRPTKWRKPRYKCNRYWQPFQDMRTSNSVPYGYGMACPTDKVSRLRTREPLEWLGSPSPSRSTACCCHCALYLGTRQTLHQPCDSDQQMHQSGNETDYWTNLCVSAQMRSWYRSGRRCSREISQVSRAGAEVTRQHCLSIVVEGARKLCGKGKEVS